MSDQQQTFTSSSSLRKRVSALLASPATLALGPAFCLSALWFGVDGAVLVAAAALPVLIAGTLSGRRARPRAAHSADGSRPILSPEAFEQRLEQVRSTGQAQRLEGCLHLLVIDDYDAIANHHGAAAADTFVQRTAERLSGALREDDALAYLGEGRFAACTGPQRHLPLEMCIQLATRLQDCAEEATAIDGTFLYATATLGFCQLSRAPGADAADWTAAAETALSHARAQGASSIRAFSSRMTHKPRPRKDLREEVEDALHSGAIRPWFQPQISTDTGQISGFEALARWIHPVRGTLHPAEFLAAVEDAGLTGVLAEKMLRQSFRALRAWDRAGAVVPRVGINLSGAELGDPTLVERIKWDLDRFDLTPDRLTIEVLETVVTDTLDDMIAHNIKALAALGCRIDLDDFGTGNASFAAIRRFAINRIKIDRSFVTHADRDPGQQRVVSAILTMAERLEVETLGEGVETVGEHALLSQLGCDHVQGYGIARPMPFDQTLSWIATHNAKLAEVPKIAEGRSK